MEQGADKKSEDEIIFEKDAAVTKSGQVSLPRDVADALGVAYGENRIKFVIKKNGTIAVEKQTSLRERLNKLHSTFTEDQKKDNRRLAGMSISEIRKELKDSEKVKNQLEEQYGI